MKLSTCNHNSLLRAVFAFLVAGCAALAVWFSYPPTKSVGVAIFHIRANAKFAAQPDGDGAVEFELYRRTQASLFKSNVVLRTALSHPSVADLPGVRQKNEPVNWLASELSVNLDSEQPLMKVSLEGDNAGELKAVLEALTSAYLNESVNLEKAKRLERFVILEKHFRKSEELLLSQRKRFRAVVANGALSPTESAAREMNIQEEMGVLRRELTQVTRQSLEIQSELMVLESIDNKLAESPIAVASINAALPNLRVMIKLLDKNLQSTSKHRRTLEARMKEYEAQILAMRANQIEWEVVKSEIDRTEKMVELILQEMESMRPVSDADGRVSLLQEVFVIPGKEGNQRIILSSVVGVATLFLGILFAAGFQRAMRLRQRVRPSPRSVSGASTGGASSTAEGTN